MNPMQWIVREAGKRPEVKNLVVELVSQRGSMTRQALPAPPGRMPAGYVLPDLSMNREGVDYLRWLRRVGHISVARAFPDIARKDPRVREILERHIATDFGEIVDPAAAKYLREWVAANPRWRPDFEREEAL